jgi:actin related protein 2/3 complex subunit 1A/1B
MKHFQTLDAKAQTQEENVTSVSTIHQNTISQVSIFAGDKNNTAKFASSGVDAQLIVWDFKTLESSIAGLRI